MTESDKEAVQFAKLMEMVKDLGYRSSQINDTTIETAMSGFKVLIFHFSSHSIQMFAGFKSASFDLKRANWFNEEYRFTKCYVTETGVKFEADFFFDIDTESAQDDLKKIFQSWEISLSFISEALTKAREENEAENSTLATVPPA